MLLIGTICYLKILQTAGALRVLLDGDWGWRLCNFEGRCRPQSTFIPLLRLAPMEQRIRRAEVDIYIHVFTIDLSTPDEHPSLFLCKLLAGYCIYLLF
jgi:hypothetical protein